MKRYLITLLCCLASFALPAQIKITGSVVDDTGETLPMATIRVQGTQVVTTTDMNGKFSLEVPSTKSVLNVSYIGFEPKSITVGNRLTLKIVLTSQATQMKETVVVGYGTQRKINLTGAVKTIGNEVLEARPISNAVQGLQGTIAGLNITNDMGGELGSEMNINIRGVGSIGEGSNSSPLVLIDGMEGDLSTINPNDIENISVLKDGASASIYGSRAPFGVILVTTKKGTQGRTSVSYTGNLRLQQPMKVPEPVDGYTYALMINDAYMNTGGNPQYSASHLDLIRSYMNGEIDYGTMPYENQNEWRKNQGCFGNTNWYDVHMKDFTTSHEHNVSVSGANDKINYFFSGNYMGQTGLFEYADETFDRMTLNGKVGIQFNKYVHFTWNTRIISTENDKPSAMWALFYHNLGRRYPVATIYLPNGDYTSDSMIPSLTQGGRTNQKKRQIYNQANLVIEPVKNWKLHAELNSRIEDNPYTRQFNPIGWHLPDGSWEDLPVLEGVENRHVINSDGTFSVFPAAGEKYYEKANTSINYFSTNVYTDYDVKFNDKHAFKFLLGEQSEFFRRETDRMATTDILLTDRPFLPSDRGDENAMISQRLGEWSNLGLFARLNYSYDNRYMAEVNLRADGASRFPKDKRWAFFPSVSAGWNIAQESFWKRLSDLGFEYLKVRGSYATLGNQNTTSFYPYYQQMQTSPGSLVLGGQQATVLPMYAPYSTNLTWETIENVGVGIDWGFLNNRLTGSFDWYQRTTKDMVGPASALSALYGASAPKTNNAELRTRGWELEIGWRDRIGKNFSYSISATLGDYRTEITKYDSPDGNINSWYKGKNYGEIWGFEVEGIAQNDAQMYAWLADHNQSSIGNLWGGGDIMYRDLNGDGSVDKGSQTIDDHGDLRVIGNMTPRFAYSFTLEAKWKWIDARVFFQGIGKRDFFFTNSATFFGIVAPWQRSLYTDHLDYFRYAGNELGANYEHPYYARLRTDTNNSQVSDRYLQDASYLRLKNLQIGFSLPKTTKLGRYVQKARLYFSAENLFTFTNLRIFDPEAIGDFENWGPGKTYPQYRTYSMGVELTF